MRNGEPALSVVEGDPFLVYFRQGFLHAVAYGDFSRNIKIKDYFKIFLLLAPTLSSDLTHYTKKTNILLVFKNLETRIKFTVGYVRISVFPHLSLATAYNKGQLINWDIFPPRDSSLF